MSDTEDNADLLTFPYGRPSTELSDAECSCVIAVHGRCHWSCEENLRVDEVLLLSKGCCKRLSEMPEEPMGF